MPTPINAANGPNTFRHDFSEPQLDLIKVYLTQLSAAEQKSGDAKQSIGLFLDFLRKEHELSEGVEWSLSFDPEGMPFMAGAPIK